MILFLPPSLYSALPFSLHTFSLTMLGIFGRSQYTTPNSRIWCSRNCCWINRRCVNQQNKTKQNKTKQNKTKQNKTKQNKTKQNKRKLLTFIYSGNDGSSGGIRKSFCPPSISWCCWAWGRYVSSLPLFSLLSTTLPTTLTSLP